MFEGRIDLGKALDFARRYAPQDVDGQELARVRQTSRADQLTQGGEGALVKLAYACALVSDHEGSLPPRVLARDAGGAAVGVASLRLNAAQREHEAARGVAPIRAQS